MRLCWNKGSLMVFSCFVSYEGYHKKGTLNFEQRMVKELWELLIRKYHSFSTLMRTIHWNNYMHERRSSQLWTQLSPKGFLFPNAKVAQFHSVNGTEISHMKKWREPKSLSARLIPVIKHCEHLCVGIVRSERNIALLETTHHTQSRPSQKSYYNHFRISF